MQATAEADFALLEALIPVIVEAGDIILEVRARGFVAERKADRSPVTEADRAAEGHILAGLGRLAPDIPVVAEEEVEAGRVPQLDGAYFLVDALDGTREFVRGGPDFTVNIGLVRDGAPVLGLVFTPVTGRLGYGLVGKGAFERMVKDGVPGPARPIHVRPVPSGPIRILASSSHRTSATDAFIARFPGAEVTAVGSSLKFVALAAGEADLYPRYGPTSQWDTAAGDAVLRAAGGRVLTLDGTPLVYRPLPGTGSAAFLNPSFFATAGIDLFD